jgi:hypothetical protein
MVLQSIKDRIFDDASQHMTRWFAELPHVTGVAKPRSARSWDTHPSSWCTGRRRFSQPT